MRSLRNRKDDERGTVVMLVAIVSIILVTLAAFAVDLGMQRVARRDMQALADAVALDLARLIDGRTADQIVAGSAKVRGIEAAKVASEARNQGSTLGEDPVVTWTLVQLDLTGSPVEDAGGDIVPVTGSAKPDAVFVTASTKLDFAFSTGSGAAGRSALGISKSGTCFRLGSYAAGLKSSDGVLLDTLLGNALDFKAIGYTGIADAKISLAGLAVELGAVTPQELMATNVSIAQLASASAVVLQRESGGVATAQVLALQKLGASATAKMLTTVTLGGLMELSSAGSSALETKVNVVDLIAGAAFLGNGTNGIKTGVIWNLPAISNTEIILTVSEVPQLACGEVNKATARTGQVSYSTSLTYQRGNSIAGLVYQGSPLLTINADVAQAEGVLTSIRCGAATPADPEGITVRVNREAPHMSFSVPVHLKGEIGIEKYTQSLSGLLGSLGYTVLQVANLLLNLNKLKIELDLEFNLGSSVASLATQGDAVFNNPPTAYDVAVPVPGSSPAAIPDVGFTRAEIHGTAKLVVDGVVKGSISLDAVDLNFLITEIVDRMIGDTVNPLIHKVNDVLTPLSTALGVKLAGADLFALPRPTCTSPSLGG